MPTTPATTPATPATFTTLPSARIFTAPADPWSGVEWAHGDRPAYVLDPRA